jgi:hypothetical protein
MPRSLAATRAARFVPDAPHHLIHSPLARWLRLATVTAAVLFVLAGLLAAPASAASAGWIRLAHLSPDTPRVDVYLTSFSSPGVNVVLKGVGYGSLSAYQRIQPGTYTVAMRNAGTPDDGEPMLSTTVTVKEGRAYTVAGVGRRSELELRVINDDLTPPPAGKAKVRVIQASWVADAVDVSTSAGLPVATDAQFATTTRYAVVPAGAWTLTVDPENGVVEPLTQTVDVQAGSVYSLLVLENASGDALQLVARGDSAGAALMPRGGVRTGEGGLAAPSSSPLPAGAAAILALGLAVLARRRTHAVAAR